MIELRIESLSASGQGVARDGDGKVYFVRGAVPGDHVRCEIVDEKSSYARARVREVVRSAMRSVKAPCQVFGRCGGCEWMDVPYERQLLWKQQMLVQSLAKHLPRQSVEAWPLEVMPSADVYGYRSRLQVRFRCDHRGRIEVGFFGCHSHRLVSIERCEVATPTINQLLAHVCDFPPGQVRNVRGILEIQEVLDPGPEERQAGAQTGSRWPVWVRLRAVRPRFGDVDALQQWIASRVLWVGGEREGKREGQEEGECEGKGEQMVGPHTSWVWDRAYGVDYVATVGGFYQSHRMLNRALREMVTERARACEPRSVYDLYCGGGNLSLALMDSGCRVVGVEENVEAIARAQHAVSRSPKVRAGQDCDVQYVQRRCELDVRMRVENGETFDLVIINPPRVGAREVVRSLGEVAREHVFYVSCQPLTLAADIQVLVQQGFEVQAAKIFDFCPHTHHFESWLHLCKQAISVVNDD